MVTRGRDVVLVLADDHWHCFDQLAATLRRRGVDTRRVVTSGRRGPVIRLVDRVVYRGVIDLRDPGAVATLDRLAAEGRVRDVQVDERTFIAMDQRSPAALRLEALDRVPWAHRRHCYDKVALAATLAAAGVRVAPVLPADGTTPAQAIAVLGLPLVVKRRTGTGGREVRVVADADELASALAELGGTDAVFFQPYLTGDLVGYGAVVRDGGAIRERTAVEHKSDVDPLGPTAWLHPCDDDAVVRAGRAVARAVAPDGLFAVEFLRAPDGTPCVIDVCLRAWGSFLAWTAAGTDFAGDHLDAIGATSRTTTPTVRSDDPPIAVFPVALDDTTGRRPRTWRLVRRDARQVGLRYGGIVAARRVIDRRRAGHSGDDREPHVLVDEGRAEVLVPRHVGPSS